MANTKSLSEEKELFKKNALPIGSVLSSKLRTYKVVEVLGAGGFGITYKVLSKTQVGNIEVDTYFAIKEYFMKGCYRDGNGTQMLYSPTLKLDVEQGKEDFMVEAKRLNKLSGQSPNIVKVNELFTANDTAYYVMEYLNGGDLVQYIKKNGILSEQNALSIFMPIAKAVELLHSERLLHLDIKPDNIVLKTDANTQSIMPVLIDFGIAKHFGRDGKPTSRLMAKGATDGYAPMEQYTDITQFAPEIDVYALGATLYYLFTGKNPPKAFDIASMAVIRDALPAQISDSTKNVIVSAMQKNKFDRTSSVHLMITAIENIASCALPFGYILKTTQHRNFQIIDIVSETKYSYTYKAIEVHSLNGQQRSDIGHRMTKVANQYIIMEYFNKSEDDRCTDGRVYRDYPMSNEAFRPFLEDVAKRAHCEINQVYFYFNDYESWQFFEANNTYYYIYKTQQNPPILKKSTKLILWGFVILVICGIGYAIATSCIDKGTELHSYYIEYDTDSVAAINVSVDEKPIVDEKNRTEDLLSISKNDVMNPSSNQPSESSKKPLISSKTEITDAERFEKAYRAKDWVTLRSLADKGYSQAYMPLARHYLNTDEHSLADKYAQKALSAGITEAYEIIEMLKTYDYYKFANKNFY